MEPPVLRYGPEAHTAKRLPNEISTTDAYNAFRDAHRNNWREVVEALCYGYVDRQAVLCSNASLLDYAMAGSVTDDTFQLLLFMGVGMDNASHTLCNTLSWSQRVYSPAFRAKYESVLACAEALRPLPNACLATAVRTAFADLDRKPHDAEGMLLWLVSIAPELDPDAPEVQALATTERHRQVLASVRAWSLLRRTWLGGAARALMLKRRAPPAP